MAEKARTPMSGAEREAKYAANMKEKDYKGEANSFVVVTDYMHHDKYMSMISIVKILKLLMIKYPTLDNLHLFSDGAAQHFKQRFFFNGVTMLPLALGKEDINITYDQFATSHGKGALDGIGGLRREE